MQWSRAAANQRKPNTNGDCPLSGAAERAPPSGRQHCHALGHAGQHTAPRESCTALRPRPRCCIRYASTRRRVGVIERSWGSRRGWPRSRWSVQSSPALSPGAAGRRTPRGRHLDNGARACTASSSSRRWWWWWWFSPGRRRCRGVVLLSGGWAPWRTRAYSSRALTRHSHTNAQRTHEDAWLQLHLATPGEHTFTFGRIRSDHALVTLGAHSLIAVH